MKMQNSLQFLAAFRLSSGRRKMIPFPRRARQMSEGPARLEPNSYKLILRMSDTRRRSLKAIAALGAVAARAQDSYLPDFLASVQSGYQHSPYKTSALPPYAPRTFSPAEGAEVCHNRGSDHSGHRYSRRGGDRSPSEHRPVGCRKPARAALLAKGSSRSTPRPVRSTASPSSSYVRTGKLRF